jgi:hypothetical protein
MTAQELDERLVVMTSLHVIENYMPVCVALNILEHEVINKRAVGKFKKQLFKLIKNGLQQDSPRNVLSARAATN